MNQTRPPAAHLLVVRFTGPSRAIAQLKTSAVLKAVTRALAPTASSVCCAAPTADAVDVILAMDGLKLLELREAWAKGLLASHQGLSATALTVLDGAGAGTVSQRRDVDDLRTIVTLRRG